MDLLSDLNESQRQAVTYTDGPLLVLAGAGSGKTRVITRRVAWMISQGAAPWSVLAITFTNKASEEMRQRMQQLRTPRGATICTFHALCARLLREFAVEANLAGNFSIYDRADQLKLTKDVMTALDGKTSRYSPSGIHAAISRAKNALQTPSQFTETRQDVFGRTVARVYCAYEQALATNHALDFDDLLLRMAFLLRDRPDIREQLGRRYQYILIDEYQDTNRAQYILAHGIAMDHQNLCATGDPDQSIYAWRGADIGNILEFEADYPNARVVRLEENYRSVKTILSAASSLIAHNQMRKEKALRGARPRGADVEVMLCDDAIAEARQVAHRIAEHRDSGGAYSDVAVFYRLNSLSRVMEQTLLESGIAYVIARGVEFYNRKEIKDVLAYLRLLVNPADDLSCLRIINTPARGIGAVTIARLQSFARRSGLSILQACTQAAQADLGAAASKVSAFAKMLTELASDLNRPVREITEDLVHRTGLEQMLQDQDESEAYANVAELISTAAEFDLANQGTETAGLADYLQQISLVSDVDHIDGGAGKGAVTLMTLHAAKGLEFPVVFILGCEDGLLPFDRSGSEETIVAAATSAEREEERRLAFVGMTRAQDRLTLSCARRRMIRGRTVPQAASIFLEEIGTEGVRRVDLTTGPRGLSHRHRQRGGFFTEIDERAAIEALAETHQLPPEYEYLTEGRWVEHPKFGRGQVLKLSQPWPETRATIHFERWGPKKIVLAKTHLELLFGD